MDKSLFVSILPDLEQSPLFNAINHDLSIFGAENTTSHRTSVAILACPSDPRSGYARDIPAGFLRGFGVADPPGGRNQMVFTSYAGLCGSFAVPALPMPETGCRFNPLTLPFNNGTFSDAPMIRFASITDGLSHTAFVTEKATTPLERIRHPAARLPFESDGAYVTGSFGATLVTSLYPINAYKIIPASSRGAMTCAASSLHPGGVNFLMGDGAVRFVRGTIDSWPFDPRSGAPAGAVQTTPSLVWENVPPPGVWQAMTTRAGGELADAEDAW